MIEALFQCLQSPQSSLREAAFIILGSQPCLIEKDPRAAQVFLNGLRDSDMDVRLAAVKATSYFILEAEPQARDLLGPWIPEMINVFF